MPLKGKGVQKTLNFGVKRPRDTLDDVKGEPREKIPSSFFTPKARSEVSPKEDPPLVEQKPQSDLQRAHDALDDEEDVVMRKKTTPPTVSPPRSPRAHADLLDEAPPDSRPRRKTDQHSASGSSAPGSDSDSGCDSDADSEEDVRSKAVRLLSGGDAKGGGAAPTATTLAQMLTSQFTPVPAEIASMKPGDPVSYAAIAATLARIGATSGRLASVLALADLLRAVLFTGRKELSTVLHLVSGQLAPAHTGLKLGVGDALLTKAVASTCGRSQKAVTDELRKTGDLGVIAMSAKAKQTMLYKPKPLTAEGVLSVYRKIATATGRASMTTRQNAIQQLLSAANGPEPQFIVRALQGRLRIGLAVGSVLAALAVALVAEEVGAKKGDSEKAPTTAGEALGMQRTAMHRLGLVRVQALVNEATADAAAAYAACPSLDAIAEAAVTGGTAAVRDVTVAVGVPFLPMLAKPANNGYEDVRKRLGGRPFTAEHKYDGERAQIHYNPSVVKAGGGEGSEVEYGAIDDATITIYSRRCENYTGKYPDVADAVRLSLKTALAQHKTAPTGEDGADSCDGHYKYLKNPGPFILDAEVVPVGHGGVLMNFQTLQRRARKKVAADGGEVKVTLFIFDVIMWDGAPTVRLTIPNRRKIVSSAFALLAAPVATSASSPPAKGDDAPMPPTGDGGEGDAAEDAAMAPVPAAGEDGATASPSAAAPAADASPDPPARVPAPAARLRCPSPTPEARSKSAALSHGSGVAASSKPRSPSNSPAPARATTLVTRDRSRSPAEGTRRSGSRPSPSCGSAGEASGASPSGAARGALQPGEYNPDGLLVGTAGVRFATHHDFGAEYEEAELEAVFEASVVAKTEGLMLKAMDDVGGRYVPGERSMHWWKLKKDYTGESIGDSVDLVPIGAYYGMGKRAGTYGSYILAVYDEDDECWQTLCKTSTGFSDAQLAECTELFKGEGKSLTSKPSYYDVSDGLATPDVWLAPTVVWEVRMADLSLSPVHRAAAGRHSSGRGVGGRFPRLLRFRDDKAPTQATTAEQVRYNCCPAMIAACRSWSRSLEAHRRSMSCIAIKTV